MKWKSNFKHCCTHLHMTQGVKICLKLYDANVQSLYKFQFCFFTQLYLEILPAQWRQNTSSPNATDDNCLLQSCLYSHWALVISSGHNLSRHFWRKDLMGIRKQTDASRWFFLDIRKIWATGQRFLHLMLWLYVNTGRVP